MPSINSVMMPLGGILPKRTGYLFRRNQHHHFYRCGIQLFEKLMGCGPEFFERRHSIYLGRCSPPLRNKHSSMNGVLQTAVIQKGQTAGKLITKRCSLLAGSLLIGQESNEDHRDRLHRMQPLCEAGDMPVSAVLKRNVTVSANL